MPKLLSRSKHEEFESNSALQNTDQKERRAENTKKMELVKFGSCEHCSSYSTIHSSHHCSSCPFLPAAHFCFLFSFWFSSYFFLIIVFIFVVFCNLYNGLTIKAP